MERGKKVLNEEEADSPGIAPRANKEDSLEKLVEKVLEKRKLVSAEEGQRRRVSFSTNIMGKPLP